MRTIPGFPIRFTLFSSVMLALFGCEGQRMVAPPADQGALIFTEVMPPLYSGDSYWIEIYNPSNDNLDMSACSFMGSDGQIVPLVFPAPVQAGAVCFSCLVPDWGSARYSFISAPSRVASTGLPSSMCTVLTIR